MKRDWELVRLILTTLEEQAPKDDHLHAEKLPGYERSEVFYHFQILSEARLIEMRGSSPMIAVALRLTWDGHEFLDKIRNEETWNKIKTTARAKGVELSIDVIKQLGKAIIDSVLGS